MPTEQVVKESQDNLSGIIDIFGTVLLVFAGISLFVAAFLIFNVFLIVVGQRVRELALLRAVGATGGQVAGSVLLEGVAVGLVASVIGYVGGLVVALFLNFVLNAGRLRVAATPQLVLSFQSVLVAFAVGIGTTLLASILPARARPRGSRRWRPCARASGSRSARPSCSASSAAIMVVIGGAAITWALAGVTRHDARCSVALGVGALVVFVGTALLSAALAGPIARALGLPFRAIYKTTGEMARQNAAREPSRTAFTAAALMIGLALVSMSFVVGSSLRTSFVKTLGTGITADWYVTTDSFFGFTPAGRRLAAAVGPVHGRHRRCTRARCRSPARPRQFSSVDFTDARPAVRARHPGGSVSPRTAGCSSETDPAKDLGIKAGDTVTVTFQETGQVQLPVLGDLRELERGRQLADRREHLHRELHRPDRHPGRGPRPRRRERGRRPRHGRGRRSRRSRS